MLCYQEGTRWFGKCWYYHEQLKYEFDVEFDIPVTYPATAPEIALPELDGKTAKVWSLQGSRIRVKIIRIRTLKEIRNRPKNNLT